MKVCSTLKFGLIVLLFASVAQAQSIDISKFYYRDYLDFGQGYGAFNGENSGKANTSNGTTLTGKDGTQVSVPNVPNFSASSNYGSLTSVGRGFAVTANHVTSPEDVSDLRKWGLTSYDIANSDNTGISKAFGSDVKFMRFNKYVVEGQVGMLDFENTTSQKNIDNAKEEQNKNYFKQQLENFRDTDGNIYIYQAGSGIVTLRGTNNSQTFNTGDSGELKGGGFGRLLENNIIYNNLVQCSGEKCDSRGIQFDYMPNGDFNNRITSGDSGSGFYAYNTMKKKWVLLGVTSMEWGTRALVSAVSNQDFADYQKLFEQKINLKLSDHQTTTWILSNNELKNEVRGDIVQESYTISNNNKDLIFSGGGDIKVTSNIHRNISGLAGGFVFTAGTDSTNPIKYTFTNANGGNYFFKGSGLDIGQNVVVEWALRNDKDDALHKIGKGELIVKTDYTPTSGENLGTLKIGEGKVTLDTNKKAFENIYITSGRGELALVNGKAQALGASPTTTNGVNSANSTTLATSYTLAQDSTNNMGFYFGKGGGKFDLAGNSLVLNTIAANDSKAIITNSSTGEAVNLEIQGLGYEGKDGETKTKSDKKADTIIHASIGDNTNGANLNLIHQGDTKTDKSLIFDGNINTSGKLSTENANIALQGHATTHATISDKDIRDKIASAEQGTSQKMPDYMDLSKPSTLKQPDWDNRTFKFGNIDLKSSNLTLGRNATLESNINASGNSTIKFGGNVKHFIDNKDGKNVTGSGFSYQQEVESGNLSGKSLEGANETISYKGKITATGGTIESHILNFNASLDLKGGAKLTADYLTLTNTDSVLLDSTSSATTKTLKLQRVSDSNLANIFKNGSSEKLKVTESLWFDNSNLDLSKLSSTNANLTLPTEYNLYAFNGSTITTANEFKNTKENAEFVLDGKSTTFTATSAVSFKSAELTLKNGAQFSANSLNFTENSIISLTDSGKLTLTGDLQTQSLNLNLSNSSTLNSKTLTSKGASTINLNDKATLTLENALSSKDLTLTLKNESKFTAKTLTASGVVNLQGDKNATLTLDTLTLDNAQANINAKADIKNLTLNNTKETAIGENVDFTTLNLNQSNANLELLNGQIPKTIDLKTQSNLYLKELNLNTSNITLKSDDSSKAHIKRLIYDAKSTQTNGANKTPQSNLSVSELFKLDNVGKNLGKTQGTEQDKLNKDLLTLEFSKNLELKNGAKLEVSFADIVKKDSKDLIFDKDYKIFSASSLKGDNLSINFKNFNGASFGGTDFYATGKLDKENNAFFVQFVRENPRNFSKLNPYINPAHSPLLEILLQHNKNDASIDKAINMRDYSTLNQRLAQIDTSLKTIANADSAALKTLPLLQKQEINARIQQNRFTTAKFALAKITNPAQKSDIVPTLLYLDENERQNRVWSGASASFFGNGSDKFSLQSVSIGYDRKLFGDEFLLGILASLTNTQLSSDETSLNPKIYTLALYSDALFKHGELQNELSFSLLNGDKGFESESGSYKSFYGFFESVYKVQTAFLPQSIKPIVLGRVNLRHFDEFSTATYKQKADDDISVDLGVGVEWLWQKESGFYSASFVAERDIYHSQKERLMSLTGAQKFVAYETNEPSFAYQLYLAGLENFKNGIYLRYGLSGFVDSKAYKGFKADVQVGYRF